MNDKVINLLKYANDIKSLDISLDFNSFLKQLSLAIAENKQPKIDKLCAWWELNQSSLIFDGSVEKFALVLRPLIFTDREKEKTEPKKNTEKTDIDPKAELAIKEFKEHAVTALINEANAQKDREEYFEATYGFTLLDPIFELLAHYEGKQKSLMLDEYFSIFKKDESIQALVNTLRLYFPNECGNDELDTKEKQITIYNETNLSDLIMSISAWVIKDHSSKNDIQVIFDEIFNNKGMDGLAQYAVKCPQAIFLLFIDRAYMSTFDNLMPVLELPFRFEIDLNGPAAINHIILNDMYYCHDALDFCGKYIEDAEKIISNFYSNYSKYRKTYFDGACPVKQYVHYDIIAKTFENGNITEHIPYALDYIQYIYSTLTKDITVIWGWYLYATTIDGKDLFWDDSDEDFVPTNKEEITEDLIEILFDTLVNNYQYEAAVSFLSLVIFRTTNKYYGSLESHTSIYSLIEKARKLPLASPTNLDKVLKYVLDNSHSNNKEVTEHRISKLLDTGLGKWKNIIKSGETQTTEFKSTLRWNIKECKKDKNIEFAILKTIAGFLNSSGGYLFIGVNDEGIAIGLEQDDFSSSDKFQLHFSNVLRSLDGCHDGYLKTKIHNIDSIDIFVVECTKAKEPIFLNNKFFIRRTANTESLTTPEAVTYIKQNFD